MSAAPNTADAWTSKYFKCLGVTVELPFTDLIDQVLCVNVNIFTCICVRNDAARQCCLPRLGQR